MVLRGVEVGVVQGQERHDKAGAGLRNECFLAEAADGLTGVCVGGQKLLAPEAEVEAHVGSVEEVGPGGFEEHFNEVGVGAVFVKLASLGEHGDVEELIADGDAEVVVLVRVIRVGVSIDHASEDTEGEILDGEIGCGVVGGLDPGAEGGVV